MKKLGIIEYPAPSIFLLSGEIHLGDVHYSEDPDDTFAVIQCNGEKKENPEGLKAGKWKHFKGGEYEVLGIVYRKKTNEKLVIYKQLYVSEKYPKGTLWGRPVDDFLGTKKIDGVKIPRFAFVEEKTLGDISLTEFFLQKGWIFVFF